jgi:copper chaperone CopZ
MTKTKTVLDVPGMTCGSCVARVRNALAIPGVAQIDVRLHDAAVTVDHDAERVTLAALVAALAGAGYQAGAR